MKIMPVLLLAIVATVGIGQIGSVKAWDEDGGGCCGFYHHWRWGDCCNQGPVGCCINQGPTCGAFCAGEQDAIYDHQQGYSYNPIGSCLPCHSQDYWNSFHQSYDQQWGSYQSQESNQGSSINVYGNNYGTISTTQASNQEQNPLQQLAHTVCGFINCGGPGPTYQQQGYDP